jgi:NAD(P)H dehydrogenase (quinone)
MNILYVYAHPNPESLNHLLKQQAADLFTAENIEVSYSDLYSDHFNAVASWHDFSSEMQQLQYMLAQQKAYEENKLTTDIKSEIKKITAANHIILQFPLWWFSTPAILKGWLDRVLVKGFAYDTGKIFDAGLLKGKTASLTVTTQSSESAYQIQGVHHATIDTFLHHIQHTLRFTGIEMLPPYVIYGAVDAERKKKEYKDYLRNIIS